MRIVLLAALALVVVEPTLACSCAPLIATDKAMIQKTNRAERVFVGRVLSSNFVDPESKHPLYREFKLRLTSSWKGDPARVVNVRSHVQRAACGVELEVGEKYLIFAYSRGDGGLAVNHCSTRRYNHARELIGALNARYSEGEAPSITHHGY